MNYELIINDLNTWQDDELLFKDYSLIKKRTSSFATPLDCENSHEYCPRVNLTVNSANSVNSLLDEQAIDEFLKKYESDPINTGFALHPETIATYRPEDEFISAGRNVSIIKHPRYFPLFFHEHAFFEMIYVLSGTCIQHFQEKAIRLQKGDLCLMAPNVKHGIEVNDDSIILNILIRYSTFMDIFMNTVRDKTQISQFFLSNIYSQKKLNYMLFHTKGDLVIRNYILDMYMEQIQLDEFSDRIICSFLTIFFTQLIRRHKKSMEIPGTHLKKGDFEDEMINYIIEHYNDISIEQVAEHFHFSRQYCSRLIKEISGYTFSELLTNIRMRQGENLLAFTTLSIEDISDTVGYKNPETFIRVFKKSAGCTPTDFRKQGRKSLPVNAPVHLLK